MESLDGEVVALRRALFLAPTDVQLHTQLGDVYLNCCDFRSAVHSYANALSLSPDDIGVRRRLAAAHCILGKLCRDTDLASALENFRHALRLQPDNLFYTLHVIRCHVQLSNFRPSLPLLNTLIARLGFRELEEQFRWHLVDIRSVRNALLENIPKQTLPMLLEVLALRAEVFLKIEKPTLAHNDVEAGLLLKPQHDKLLALRERLQQVARDLLNVGIAASLAGQLDKATLQLSRSLFLQPYNVRTYWHRARSFRLRKIFDRALEDLDSGLYLQQKKMRGHDINNALLDPLAPPPRADDGAMGALDMATSPQQPAAASPMNPLSSGLPAGMTAHPSISAAPRPASSPLSSAPPLPLPVDSKGSVNSALPGLDVASANQEDTGGDAKPASRQLTVATQDTEQDSASGSRVRTLNACAPKHNTPPTGTPAGTTPTSDPTTPATPTTPAPAMPATPATPATPAMPVVASAEHGSETPQLFPRSSTLLRLTAPSPMKPRPLIDTQSTPSPHASQPAGDALQTGSLAFARLLTPLSVPVDAPVFPAPTQPWRARQHNLLRRRASAILLRPSPGALHEAQQNFSRQLREHSPAPPPGAADNSGKARHTLKHARSTPLLSHTPHGTDDQPEHLHARPSRQRHSSARPSRGAASPALTRVVTLRRNLQACRSLVSDFIGQGLGDVGRDAGDTAAIPAAAPSTGDNADTQGGVDELDVPREQALQAMLSEQTKATAVATEPGGSHQAAGDRTDSERQPHAAVTVAVAAGPSSSVAGAGSEWAGGPGVLSPLAWRAHQPAAVGSQGAGGGTRSAQQWSVGASGAPVMDMLGGADTVENEEKRRQEQKEEEREEEEDEDEEDEEVRRDDCQALEVSSADQPVVSEDEALAAALYQELALTFNDQGLAFFSMKKFALAAECLSRSVVLQPDVAAHIMTRGDCFSAMGELDRALADYTEAYQLEPSNNSIRARLASAHFELGRRAHNLTSYDHATEEFSKAIGLNGSVAEYFVHRALTHMQREDLLSAMKDFREAVRLQPTHRSAVAQLQALQRQLAPSAPASAVAGIGAQLTRARRRSAQSAMAARRALRLTAVRRNSGNTVSQVEQRLEKELALERSQMARGGGDSTALAHSSSVPRLRTSSQPTESWPKQRSRIRPITVVQENEKQSGTPSYKPPMLLTNDPNRIFKYWLDERVRVYRPPRNSAATPYPMYASPAASPPVKSAIAVANSPSNANATVRSALDPAKLGLVQMDRTMADEEFTRWLHVDEVVHLPVLSVSREVGAQSHLQYIATPGKNFRPKAVPSPGDRKLSRRGSAGRVARVPGSSRAAPGRAQRAPAQQPRTATQRTQRRPQLTLTAMLAVPTRASRYKAQQGGKGRRRAQGTVSHSAAWLRAHNEAHSLHKGRQSRVPPVFGRRSRPRDVTKHTQST